MPGEFKPTPLHSIKTTLIIAQQRHGLHTCRDRRGPRQPVVESAVAVVQPVFVFCPRQAVPELYDITDLGSGYSGVRRWRADGWAIIQTVPRTILAEIARYLDREIGRIRDLQTKHTETVIFMIGVIDADRSRSSRVGRDNATFATCLRWLANFDR